VGRRAVALRLLFLLEAALALDHAVSLFTAATFLGGLGGLLNQPQEGAVVFLVAVGAANLACGLWLISFALVRRPAVSGRRWLAELASQVAVLLALGLFTAPPSPLQVSLEVVPAAAGIGLLAWLHLAPREMGEGPPEAPPHLRAVTWGLVTQLVLGVAVAFMAASLVYQSLRLLQSPGGLKDASALLAYPLALGMVTGSVVLVLESLLTCVTAFFLWRTVRGSEPTRALFIYELTRGAAYAVLAFQSEFYLLWLPAGVAWPVIGAAVWSRNRPGNRPWAFICGLTPLLVAAASLAWHHHP
jgi:hypothetical protein